MLIAEEKISKAVLQRGLGHRIGARAILLILGNYVSLIVNLVL